MKQVTIRRSPILGTIGRKTGEPRKQPHEYAKNGTAKLLTLFHPATGKVRVKGVTACPNVVLHEWLQQELTQILASLPAPPELSPEDTHAQWQRWQEGLQVAPSIGEDMPPLRLLLVLDNLSGHHTPRFVMWLCEHGIMPLYTPLGGSWLNMSESIQRIIVRRALDGEHPITPQQITSWLEETARGWNADPTPFVWGGKRKRRRDRARDRRHALGGSGAYSRRPSGGKRLCLRVLVRKCFCDVSTCARKIFSERLTPFIEPYARVTVRLFQIVQAIGFATGGMLGARLAERLGIQTSWMTVLRRMMALPTEPVERVSQLGIDDFSFRRGRTFGTILVDMQSHEVIDVLPEESRAAPLSTEHAIHPPKLKPKKAELSQAKREERLAQYQQVVTLRKLGYSQTAIADQVGISHSTVSRWLSSGTFPEQQPRPRKMELDSHLSYLAQRWEAGCHNIAELHRELVTRGYRHSYWSVYEQLVRFLPS